MTDDSNSSNFEEEDAGSGQPRRVPKTMLEQNLPQAQKPAVAKTMLEQHLPQAQNPRVAKTMLESELPSSNSGLNSQARRKVAKTLIDRSVTEEKVLRAAEMQEEVFREAQERPHIAKTLIEHSLQNYYENDEQVDEPQYQPADSSSGYQTSDSSGYADSVDSSYAPRRGPSQNFVAKTMLDHSLLFDALAKSSAKKEQKAAEIAAVKALEPEVPFIGITNFKKASTCAWTWEETDTKERFRYCGQCQASVYNFEGMELPEAKALIFKRENREKTALYKRADGKFMTSDCPVAIKKKRNTVSLVAIGAAVALAIVAIVALTPPPPPAPPQPVQVTAPPVPERHPGTASAGGGTSTAQSAQSNPANGTQSSASGKQLDGSFHWDSGASSNQSTSASSTPTPVDVPAATNANEDGSNWEFSNKESAPAGQTNTRPVLPQAKPAASPYTNYSMR